MNGLVFSSVVVNTWRFAEVRQCDYGVMVCHRGC